MKVRGARLLTFPPEKPLRPEEKDDHEQAETDDLFHGTGEHDCTQLLHDPDQKPSKEGPGITSHPSGDDEARECKECPYVLRGGNKGTETGACRARSGGTNRKGNTVDLFGIDAHQHRRFSVI